MNWLYLAIAIGAEVLATSALKATQGFTQWRPSVLAIVGYGCAFFFLSLTLRSIPVGVAYAIWSGVGVVLVSVTSWLLYQQVIDLAAMLGIGLIVSGVLVINLFSTAATH